MKDCKYKIIQIICIISLVCVFVVQVLFILKKSWVGDVLNPTKIASKVDNNNLIYGMALDIVKFKMNDKTSSNNPNVWLLMDDEKIFNSGLIYYFSKYSLYPINVISSRESLYIGDKEEAKNVFERDIINQDVDYIICFSSCDWIIDTYELEVTKNYYKLLLLKPGANNDRISYEIVLDLDFSIEEYREYFAYYDKLEQFNNYINYFSNNAKYYNDDFSNYIMNSLSDY